MRGEAKGYGPFGFRRLLLAIAGALRKFHPQQGYIMNNACASRWCRRPRIIIKRQWRRFEKHPMRLFWWLTGIITAIFILCIIFTDDKGTVYTAFGSYFTALAFVGVIVTVLLQRAELQEQRKELRAQRIELEGQKRELEIQNRTAQLQRFENSFFNRTYVQSLVILRLQGQQVFQRFLFGCREIAVDLN